MKYTNNAINIITTKRFKGIGRAWIVKNLKGNESVEDIVAFINNHPKRNDLITIDDFETQKSHVISEIEKFGDSCDGIVAIGDKNFPQYRGTVKKESELPVFLFYKGNLSLLDLENHNITVIGLLNPDEEIENREKKAVSEIIKEDITVVSGLAFGCDSIAHEQALSGGKTIAILPSPLYKITPAKNKDLAVKIVEEGGLLITEYIDEHNSLMDLSSRYKERDRLQALFCDAIILVASYAQDSAKRWGMYEQKLDNDGKAKLAKLDSGARLAMGFAKNYKIPRAVMYNENTDKDNPMFDLNRELINEGTTILTLKNLQEIISEIKRSKEIQTQGSWFG